MSMQIVHAADVKLKRGCIKDNPLVQGVLDPNLLSIYTQICDKKNKEQRDQYLILAANRFQQLGMNDRALQIVNQLEAKQVKNTQLTDIKFLIGTHLAGDALAKMREQESRLLTQDLTYPPAQILADNIRRSVPSSIVKRRTQEQKRKETQHRAQNQKQTQTRPPSNRNKNTTTLNRAQPDTSNTQKNTAIANTTPFSGL